MKIRCLPFYVYRNSTIGDCTNSGVSSMFNELLVYCPTGHRSFESTEEIPLNFCMVDKKVVMGKTHYNICPACVDDNGKVVKRPYWWMNGGNIAHACDSRVRDLTGDYSPLMIHDRREW